MPLPPATKLDGEPFTRDERATSNTVDDSNPDMMLDDPAIQADRLIACECECATVGEHNESVTQRERLKRRVNPRYDINVRTTYFYRDDVEVYALHDEDLPPGHRYAEEVQKIRDMLSKMDDLEAIALREQKDIQRAYERAVHYMETHPSAAVLHQAPLKIGHDANGYKGIIFATDNGMAVEVNMGLPTQHGGLYAMLIPVEYTYRIYS